MSDVVGVDFPMPCEVPYFDVKSSVASGIYSWAGNGAWLAGSIAWEVRGEEADVVNVSSGFCAVIGEMNSG